MYEKLVPCCAKKLEDTLSKYPDVFCRLLGRLCVCVYIEISPRKTDEQGPHEDVRVIGTLQRLDSTMYVLLLDMLILNVLYFP